MRSVCLPCSATRIKKVRSCFLFFFFLNGGKVSQQTNQMVLRGVRARRLSSRSPPTEVAITSSGDEREGETGVSGGALETPASTLRENRRWHHHKAPAVQVNTEQGGVRVKVTIVHVCWSKTADSFPAPAPKKHRFFFFNWTSKAHISVELPGSCRKNTPPGPFPLCSVLLKERNLL